MEKVKVKKQKIKKVKEKLSKPTIARRIILCLSAICLGFAIFFTVLKSPIKDSIYLTNTSLEERQETWENSFDEWYKYYNSRYSPSDFETKLSTSRFLKLLYSVSVNKTSETTKEVSLTIFNYTDSPITMRGAFYFDRIGDTSSIRVNDSQGKVFTSKEYAQYHITVDNNFNLDDYMIVARGVDDDNDGVNDWDIFPVTSYENELERTKLSQISKDIYDIIGEKPTFDNESKNPLPEYVQAIIDARLRYILLYISAGILFIFGMICRDSVFMKSHPMFEPITYPIPRPAPSETKTEVIIKEIHHAPKIKKVVCLHCGSRYKDNLDECPKCGSAKIKGEPEE